MSGSKVTLGKDIQTHVRCGATLLPCGNPQPCLGKPGSQHETSFDHPMTLHGTCRSAAELFTLLISITHGVLVSASVGSFCLDRRSDKVAGSYYHNALVRRMGGILPCSAGSLSVFNDNITNKLCVPTSQDLQDPKDSRLCVRQG